MKKLLWMVAVILSCASSARAQTASECASGTSTGLDIQGWAGEVQAQARTDDPYVCSGRGRVEVWLVNLADVCYQPVSSQGGVWWQANIGSCVNEGLGNGQGLGRWASAGTRHVNGLLGGWIRAESHHFYIHTDGSWSWPWANGARAAEVYIPPQQGGGCDPNADGNGNGIYGEPDDCGSPILVPLTPNGAIRLTSLEDGVRFDLNGDGVPERMAWTAAGAPVALLAIDRNGNGRIDNGTELLGEFTVPGVANGFSALDALNGHTGALLSDALFDSLLLWTDRNHNGRSERGELQPARRVLNSVSLAFLYGDQSDEFGNLFKFVGSAEYRDGRIGAVPDVYFVTDYGESDAGTRAVDRERTRNRWKQHLAEIRASRR